MTLIELLNSNKRVEIFTEIVEDDSCDGCMFDDAFATCPNCMKDERDDNQNVIFKYRING